MNKYVLIKEEVSVVSKEEDGKRGSGGKRERGEKEFAVYQVSWKVILSFFPFSYLMFWIL